MTVCQKSWANNFMTLRGRWELSREADKTLDELWAWVDKATTFKMTPLDDTPNSEMTGIPSIVKATVKTYKFEDTDFMDAVDAKVVFEL